MIFGVILGILFCLAVVLVFVLLVGWCIETDRGYQIALIVCSICAVVALAGGILIGLEVDNADVRKYCGFYAETKRNCESFLESESLSDIEKHRVLKDIVVVNAELAENKVEYHRWFYCGVDNDLIAQLDALEPIEID